jgi:hypothetical protein
VEWVNTGLLGLLCCVVLALQWQRGAGVILAMHRFSPTGQIAINKGYAVLLNGKLTGLSGFNCIKKL